MKPRILFLFWGAVLLPLALPPMNAAQPLRSVSTTVRTNIAAAAGSFTPGFSSDGRFLVFVSHANNLVTNDDLGPYLDVFMRDLTASNTVLVSVNMTGTGGGNADANFPSLSSNGQFVAFASAASNLANNDTNDAPDIFVRDLVASVTTLVSVDVTGTSSAAVLSPERRNHLTSNPLISADGGWVIFESFATNMVAVSDTNHASDIFARNLLSKTTCLVSVNAAGTASGNGNSESPGITPDGRLVAFVSTSTDLVSGVTNQLGDVYVRDLQSETTVWASADVAAFFTGAYRCFNPVLSADGRSLTFKANSPLDANTVMVVHHDLQTGLSTVLTSNSFISSFPQISAEGRFVASESLNDIYIWDVEAGSNALVSVNAAGTAGGNAQSHTPVMTADGRSVVFLSAGTDLVAGATNGVSQVFVRDLVTGATRLVSANLDGLASSSEVEVTLPAISSNGRRAAFESMGADLAANDLNQANDIFLRDLNLETTQLISERHPALLAKTTAALTGFFPKSISADGRYLGFASVDNNLVPNDTNGLQDIFVRDLSSGNISAITLASAGAFASGQGAIEPVVSANGRYLVVGAQVPCLLSVCQKETLIRFDLDSGTHDLVSVRFDRAGAPNASCSAPAISSDGNLIAFQSIATDLIDSFGSSYANVFIRDMSLAVTKLVSNAFGDRWTSRSSGDPLFSPDDRWVLFTGHLVTNGTDGLLSLFVRDVYSNTTRMISVAPDGSSPLGYLRGAVFSADSQHAAFVSSTNSVVVYDLLRGGNIVVCATCDRPSLSADGRLVAYEIPRSGTSTKDIIMKDLQTGANSLISVNRLNSGGGNGDSTSPLVSWDGRFVVFASKASDLVDNDTNDTSDIFVRDRLLGTTLLVSQNLQGTSSGNGPSTKPMLSADGRTVVFQSFASDLVPGDYNERRDVFVLRLGGADTDGDGIDDEWEMAYFSTLARDGTGDFDGDGQTDLQEFLAGTDPTNSGSILRMLTLTPLGGGGTRVIWAAAPGKRYQVQFKDNLSDSGWTNLPGVAIAGGTTASVMDGEGLGNRRFYRVILAP